MTGTESEFQGQASRAGATRRRYVAVALTVILVLFFILAAVPVTAQRGLFVGRSPNRKTPADLNCGVNLTTVTVRGYGTGSYAFLGVGAPAFYFTTTAVVPATETNASTGQAFGHTAYTITVDGGLGTLRAEANTTSGPVRYGCAYLIPEDGAPDATTIHPTYTAIAFADGTVVRFYNC